MKFRLLFLTIFFAVVCIGGVFLYKKLFTSQQFSEKKVYIYSAKALGVKEDIGFIKKSLKLYDIKRNQIIENPQTIPETASVKIFFDQKQFDEAVKLDDPSLKIAIRLRENYEEDCKILGVFIEDKHCLSLLNLLLSCP